MGKARELHPDGYGGRPTDEVDVARRGMQDVNEAWRVLRDPALRSAYDQLLLDAPAQARARVAHPTAPVPDDALDRPYPRQPLQPGDMTVAVVRAAPWVAVLVVLAVIFVFTAVAKNDDGDDTMLGKCITTVTGRAQEVPCDRPNDGQVLDIVQQANQCKGPAEAKVMPGGTWFCLGESDGSEEP